MESRSGVRDLNSLAAISESFDVPSKGQTVRKPTWKWLRAPDSLPPPFVLPSPFPRATRCKAHTHTDLRRGCARSRITSIAGARAHRRVHVHENPRDGLPNAPGWLDWPAEAL